MEYRKRRTVTRRRRHGTQGDEGAFGKVVLFFVLVGGLVYLISASAAGTWLSQNVFAPIFEAFRAVDGEYSPEGSNPVFAGTNGEGELTLAGVNCYLLQMGLYSTEDNANTAASAAVAAGAAGFVLKDGGSYRVFAALYSTKDDAESVRERLSGEGLSYSVREVAAGNAHFSVSGMTEKQKTEFTNAFSELSVVHEKLSALAVEFDATNMSVAEGKERVFAIASDLKTKCEPIKVVTGEAVSAIVTGYENILAKLMSLYDGDAKNTIDFSRGLKYNSIDVLYEYVQLLEEFDV